MELVHYSDLGNQGPTRGPQRLRQRKHMNVALLVIDEIGFGPMSQHEASLFFRLVSYRYGRGAILITTNKGIQDWPDVLAGDEVLATATRSPLAPQPGAQHHGPELPAAGPRASGHGHAIRGVTSVRPPGD